jgi:hypothetical protein
MPGGMQPGEGAAWMPHATPWWDGPAHILPIVLFAALLGVLVWGILRLSSDRAVMAAAAAPVAAPPAPIAALDPAGTELRVRYARGDITREEYLTRSADLGLPGPAPEAPTQG